MEAIMAEQVSVTLSEYRRKIEEWSFQSWADARDRLPAALAPLKTPLWKALSHADQTSAKELQESLLGRRWAFTARPDGCDLRRITDGYLVEVRGIYMPTRARTCGVLKALEVEAEDAFIGA
jgi:hypothetical protein